MLYIIRHGETELNRKHVLQGRSDHALIAKGIDQGRKAADWIRKEGISFSRVYSSPLKRAVQTAECVAPGITVVTDERLIEMDYGPYEGMSLFKPGKEVLKFFRDFANNPAPDGMEQLSDIVARTGEFVESIKEECIGTDILISTHAIAMKGILEYLDRDANGRYWSKNIGNCEIYKVACTDGKFGTPESVFKINES
uniref:Fructose-2,6-bisphosphatase n=1 Tax=Eubacterium cellulosolvens (strain ATCC 43171 / JCM 9499 / 6) TaxID=633697 RepID=I5AW73_EUBC6